MRLEIDGDLEKVLDGIREREWQVHGRGHAETVRFLANYYRQHKAVEKVLDERLREIPGVIQSCFLDSMRLAVTNLLRAKEWDVSKWYKKRRALKKARDEEDLLDE